MDDYWQLEESADQWLLEDSSGLWELEESGAAAAFFFEYRVPETN